jgi:alpha-L-fucosidase 2
MKSLQLTLIIFAINLIVYAQDPLIKYKVIWDSPSVDYNGSMPIGNGDISANVWVEEGGDLLFYIGKTDSYSENVRLLKLGKLRVRLNPNPFEKGCAFKQELDLKNGVIKISSSGKSTEASVDLRFRVDANNPVIRINGNLSEKTSIEVVLEHWRTVRTKASAADRSFSGLLDREAEGGGFAYPVFVEPDTVVKGRSNSIVWYHRNRQDEHSIWEETLRVQGLEGFMTKSADPLLNLTFGALVEGEGLVSESPTTLQSSEPTKTIDISVFPLTAQTAKSSDWIKKVETQALDYKSKSEKSVLAAHTEWWNQFWDRSWIYVNSKSTEDAFIVGSGYILQSWITACGGRGNMPIRFNGSIFNVDGIQPNNGINYGPDYRAWGSAYWWQNTRLPYWSMAAAGNYDMMKPLFKMYMDALPLAKYRMQNYYGFDGAYFPETMYFWGAYRNEDYSWHPEEGRDPDIIRGHHIRYEWQGGIELTAMMVQYYRHTLDSVFLNNMLLPFARQITMFYDKRYKRNEEGKLVIYPANALEEIFYCTNPTPELAGLRFILPQLAKLTGDEKERNFYIHLLDEIPELESDISNTGQAYILPAREAEKRRDNCEKPECYALFPYRLYGVGLTDLEIAKETFRLSPKAMRGIPRNDGWVQDPIFAACVGDVEGASERMIARSKHIHKDSRFPGFWESTFAWVPNQDHGGVNMIALQHMLIQTDPWSDKIHLCPAWPEEWDCSFKLHAPGKTLVQGRVKNGKVLDLKVTPKNRKKDIVNHLNPEN